MKIFLKALKIIIGLLFGLSALSLFTGVFYSGFNISFGIAIFQATVAFFLLRSAFRKSPNDTENTSNSENS